MSFSYCPRRQQDLRDYMNGCAALLVGSASKFGVTQGEADSFKQRADAFSVAVDLVLNPLTRNIPATAIKTQKRAELLQLARPLLQRIRDDLGVAAEDKLALGLKLPSPQSSPVPVPVTAPVLEIVGEGMTHMIRYHDESMPGSAAKVKGAASLVLFATIAPTIGTPETGGPGTPVPEEARFVRTITRQRCRVQYTSAELLKTVYYWARWQTATGELGPWSAMVSKVVA